MRGKADWHFSIMERHRCKGGGNNVIGWAAHKLTERGSGGLNRNKNVTQEGVFSGWAGPLEQADVNN